MSRNTETIVPRNTETIAASERNPFKESLVRGEQTLRDVARRVSAVHRDVKDRLGLLDPARLDLYIGMGTPNHVVLRGRALEDPPLREPKASDSYLKNLRRSLRSLETDEVPNLTVELRVENQRVQTVTDAGGFFRCEIRLESALPQGWVPFSARTLGRKTSPFVEGRICIPTRVARFLVISDIDDTILKTHVRNRFKMALVTLLGNALTRLSFDGAAEFYRELQDAGGGAPFFYVSRSAWNIHHLLEHFIAHNRFPEGPLILREAGLFTPPAHLRGSKSKSIEEILELYAPLPCVLIGDSGQRDAAIYTDIANRHPGRVRAILIRKITSEHHVAKTRNFLESSAPCPWLVFDDHIAALRFCEKEGLVGQLVTSPDPLRV